MEEIFKLKIFIAIHNMHYRFNF